MKYLKMQDLAAASVRSRNAWETILGRPKHTQDVTEFLWPVIIDADYVEALVEVDAATEGQLSPAEQSLLLLDTNPLVAGFFETINDRFKVMPKRVTDVAMEAGEFESWLTMPTPSVDITGVGMTTIMTITGVGIGRYAFKCLLIYQTTANTTGIRVAVNHTGTTSRFIAEHKYTGTGSAASTGGATSSGAGATGNIYEGQGSRTKDAVIGRASCRERVWIPV